MINKFSAGGLLVPEGSWWTISPSGKLMDY
jgi:hypothetical protein